MENHYMLLKVLLFSAFLLLLGFFQVHAEEPAISAGGHHSVGLKSEGIVVAVGWNYYGQCNVSSWTGINQIDAGHFHTVGLRTNGSVIAIGWNRWGQCDTSYWTGITQIAAGGEHTAAITTNGTVVTAGYNYYGQRNTGSWIGITQIAAGYSHTVGLNADGTVVAVGWNGNGECNVSSWTGITQIAAGYNHTVGLNADGAVVAVGWNGGGQCNVSSWTGITQIAAGIAHTVGLKNDGTVVAVGLNNSGECNVSSWTDITQIAAGLSHTVGLKSDGTVVAVGRNDYEQCNLFDWNLNGESSLVAPIANAGENQTVHLGDVVTLDGSGSSDPEGNYPLSYSWSFESIIPGDFPILSDPTCHNPTFICESEGDYVLKLVVTNSAGTQSEPAYVIVSTYNTDPVAEAGDDMSLTVMGSSIQLDGTQSYDPDGDSLTYSWSIGAAPAGSTAVISNADTAMPLFSPDIYGTYTLNLMVTDEWGLFGLDHVILSFDNVKPIAIAGQNQSLIVGDAAYLNGFESFDANGDRLSYRWSIISKPDMSLASIADLYAIETSFVVDVPGSYVVSLVVNDGIVNSDSSNINIQVISQQTALTDTILEGVDIINSIPLTHFKNTNMANTLTNKLNAVLQMIDQGMYAEALEQLQNDILKKTDGCVLNGSPEKKDWIKDCNYQEETHQIIMDAITRLQSMM